MQAIGWKDIFQFGRHTNSPMYASIAYLNCHNTLLFHFRLPFFASFSIHFFLLCVLAIINIIWIDWLKPRVHFKWMRQWTTENDCTLYKHVIHVCIQNTQIVSHTIAHTNPRFYRTIQAQKVNQFKKRLLSLQWGWCGWEWHLGIESLYKNKNRGQRNIARAIELKPSECTFGKNFCEHEVHRYVDEAYVCGP